METMVCEPVDKELPERVRLQFGEPTRSVQIKVGMLVRAQSALEKASDYLATHPSS
jgi:hypothetical protein